MVSWIVTALLATTIVGQDTCTVVYFGRPNCQPCQQMMPTLVQLKQEGWDIRDVDTTQRPDLAKQYRIENLPTLVIVSSEREVDRVVGAVPYEQLQSRFVRAAARNRSSVGSSTPIAVSNAPANVVATKSASSGSHGSPANPGPIVRGQSPAADGFPMLTASASSALAALVEATPHAEERQPDPQTQVQPQASSATTYSAPSASFASHNTTAISSRSKAALTVDQAIARAAAATVRIVVEEASTIAYGTGTIIDAHGEEALILTCGHLFRDMQPGSQLSVELFAGTPRQIKVFAKLVDFKAEDEDIAVLSVQLPVAIEPVEILPRRETLQIGQAAFSFGCDHGKDPTRRDTRVCNINRFMGAPNVEIEGAPVQGRSGGGLFDSQGRLIGVCNGADPADNQGIYAAAEVVYAQIERLGMSHLIDAGPGPAASLAPTRLAVAESGAAEGMQSSAATAFASQPVSETPSWGATDQPAEELICIFRDAAGQSRVVNIAAPSATLLQAIQQDSKVINR